MLERYDGTDQMILQDAKYPMRITYALMVCMLVTSYAGCQNDRATFPVPDSNKPRCSQSGEQARPIFGLRLGMSYQEARYHFPELPNQFFAPPTSRGIGSTIEIGKGPSTKRDGSAHIDPVQRPELNGVSSITIYFRKGRVRSIEVRYANGGDYPNPDDFAAYIAKTLGLVGAWDLPGNSYSRELLCDHFLVTASLYPNGTKNPYLKIEDLLNREAAATATMGSAHHPIVISLREWRDSYLIKSQGGRVFVRVYYRGGVYPARLIRKSRLLRTLSLNLIVRPLAWVIRKHRVQTDNCQVKTYR